MTDRQPNLSDLNNEWIDYTFSKRDYAAFEAALTKAFAHDKSMLGELLDLMDSNRQLTERVRMLKSELGISG